LLRTKLTTKRPKNAGIRIALLALILICLALEAPQAGLAGRERFVPPDITKASDIPYPVEVVASGLVTLSLNLTTDGQAPTVQVLRDIQGLTSLASTIVTAWRFTPGTLDGNPTPSTMNVQIVFNANGVQGQTLQVPPVAITPPPFPAGYLPAEVAAASYATYPVSSVGQGAVVLDVTVDEHGETKKIGVIRDVPSLTPQAIAAVKSWTINAATFNGKPITSKLVVAYVFSWPKQKPRSIGVQ
jgi:hypothetical protein